MRMPLPLLASLLISCGTVVEGDWLGDCVDGEDNDRDNLVDCDDPGCAEACAEDTDTDADTDIAVDNDTGTPSPCASNRVEDVFPASGSSSAFAGTAIQARLDDPDPTAVLAVPDVTGSSSVFQGLVTFTPDSYLAPDTTYTPTLSWSSGACETSWSFTTSDVGNPVEPSTLIDKVYELELANGRYVEPAGVGSLLGKYLGDSVTYVGVVTADSSALTLRVASGTTAGSQDACAQSTDLAASFISPFFATSDPTSLHWDTSDVVITVDDASLSGAFREDASALEGVTLAGRIDTRPLVPLVEENGQPDAICELAASIGVSCIDCGNGEVYCLDLLVDSMVATEVSVALADQSAPYDPCVDHASECPDTCN